MDAVPFLKATQWLLSSSYAPDESPRSSDRAAAALWRRDLLEDVVLELTACGSPEVVWCRAATLWCCSGIGLPLTRLAIGSTPRRFFVGLPCDPVCSCADGGGDLPG